MTDRLAELSAAGVAVWLDDLSRQRLDSGNLDQLRRERHVVGVTTNPTIFAKALADSDVYQEPLHELAVRGMTVDEAARLITTFDVRWACDVMRPAYDASGGVDGRISIECDPRLANRTEATIAEAKLLWWLVDRPNLFIKIPGTEAGLPAITEVLANGISVNVTLIFSLERYEQVMDAFMTGLERAREAGHDLSTIGSVASFFVSRVDTEVDKRLEKIAPERGEASDAAGGTAGTAKELIGKAAIANARLAYQRYERAFGGAREPDRDNRSSDRWRALADAGARPQRPLWASTSVKDPAYRDTQYVEQLIAPGVVNTMPEQTLQAYADHGRTEPDTITGGYAEAQRVLDDLAGLGIDYDDVVAVLEREGVEKFEASWQELLETVETQLKAAR